MRDPLWETSEEWVLVSTDEVRAVFVPPTTPNDPTPKDNQRLYVGHLRWELMGSPETLTVTFGPPWRSAAGGGRYLVQPDRSWIIWDDVADEEIAEYADEFLAYEAAQRLNEAAAAIIEREDET